eukprot:jgi/Bigna1/70850/fgenesh1_pg.13_\
MRIYIKPILGAPQMEARGMLQDTVKSLKIRVWAKLKIPPSHQKMVFSGKVLEDSRTIQDCRIVDGCSIYLVINAGREAVQIKIRHLCGDPFRVTVDRRWTTIATIKQYIKHTLQVPLESQVLLRSGMIMSNEQTLNSIAYQKTDTSFFLVPYSLEDLNASATKQIQLREQKARSNRAALLIQKWWRGISAKLKEKKRQLASTYIQSWFRGYLGKIRLNLAVSTIKAKQHARLREVLRVWRWHAVRRAFELWRRACCARTTVDDDDDDDKEEEEEEEEEEEADLLLREEELMEKEMKSHSSIYIQSCSSGEYTGGVKLKIAVDEMKRRMVSTGEAAAMIRIIQQQWLLLLLLLLHNQLFKFTCRNLAREARSVLLKCLNSTILDFEEREECIQAALYRIQHNIPKYAAAWYYRTAGELESSRPLLLSVTSVNNEETGCDLGCDVAFLSCIYRDHGTLIYSEKISKINKWIKAAMCNDIIQFLYRVKFLRRRRRLNDLHLRILPWIITPISVSKNVRTSLHSHSGRYYMLGDEPVEEAAGTTKEKDTGSRCYFHIDALSCWRGGNAVRARPSSTVPTASDGDGFNYMMRFHACGIQSIVFVRRAGVGTKKLRNGMK